MYGGPTVTASYITRRPLAPKPDATTSTAPTVPLALARAFTGDRTGRPADRLWGSLPIDEVEGHQVEGAFDVRPIEGLGRAPIRSEMLGYLGVERADRGDRNRRADNRLSAPYLRTAAATPIASATREAREAGAGSGTELAPAEALASVSSFLPLLVLGGLYFLVKR